MAWIYVGPGGKRWSEEGERREHSEGENPERRAVPGEGQPVRVPHLANLHPFAARMPLSELVVRFR